MKEKVVYLDFLETSYKKKIKIMTEDKELIRVDKDLAKKYCNNLSCSYITIYCKEYPNNLKLLPNPPLVIYYYGNISLINTKQIAVIGSRNNSVYGYKYTKELLKNIDGYTITSGYAYGIDQLAHRFSIENNLNTIAVLGGGFEHIYPKNDPNLFQKIKATHLVISEYPPNIVAKPWMFLMRNRLIAALTDMVLVIEATCKSGSLKTVEIALEQNKEIYALPGSVFAKQSSGTNMLIEEGANILTTTSKFINIDN